MTSPVIDFVKAYLRENLHLSCGEIYEDIEIPEEEVTLFVSLESDGMVRGVGGDFERKEPLHKALERTSFSSAFSDDRFAPLRPEELSSLKISVTFVNPVEIMNSVVIES